MKTLQELAAKHGTDKGSAHSYMPIYDRLLGPLREKKVRCRLVEIGVDQGQSMRMWREAFPLEWSVEGIENDGRNFRWGDLDGCQVHPIDATDGDYLDRVFANGCLDVVIDDGSHRERDYLLSWCWLWPKVRPGGLYFIEDVTGTGIPRLEALGFEVHDLRAKLGRWDDVLAVMRKN